MKTQLKDPFEGLILDEYEQEIEDSAPDRITFKVSPKELKDFALIAKNHNLFRVSKRINIRINNLDLVRVKSRAKSNNIPYQTLIGSLVHKYANGTLKVEL